MVHDEHNTPGRLRRVDDTLGETDLTVARALELIEPAVRDDFKATYDWFQDHTGETGSRLYGHGERLPNVSPDFPHAAQRGIHKPRDSDYALTVTVKKNKLYGSDSNIIELPNGTWEIVYSEHRNNTGGKTSATYNDSLTKCLEDGVPVGVFYEVEPGSYFRALAFVEEYRPEDGTFILHGPVTKANEGAFRSEVHDYLLQGDLENLDFSIEELMKDERTAKEVRQKVREGQRQFRLNLMKAYEGTCAVTGFKTDCVLQAAHILDYRGGHSNLVTNGVLLRSDIHTLFDRSLLAINPETMRIHVARTVPDQIYRDFSGRPLRLPETKRLRPNLDFLRVKYEKFQLLNEAV